ncbi:MAG: hypothetical protein KF745_11925 [Phycisphaeraceae bacterium]|nr:hypothetical protein [Phycisphaeraceae bacterium]
MDLTNPAVLLSGLFIGTIGVGLFIHGKKSENIKTLITGIVMCVFPYFVGSVALLWLGAAACLGGLYAWSRYA